LNGYVRNTTYRALEDHDPVAALVVAGTRIMCDFSGCAFLPDSDTMIVSDLHLEKGSSHARHGRMLPPYDTRTTLARLASRIAYWQPQTVISLGDSFHDRFAHERIAGHDLEVLSSLMAGRQWVWISGNHDPDPPEGLGGDVAAELHLGPLIFRHEPNAKNARGEIAGHLHPAAKVATRAKTVRRPCFATDGERLILPSFGAYTGGLNIRDRAFAGLFVESRLSALVLGSNRVFHISARNLVA